MPKMFKFFSFKAFEQNTLQNCRGDLLLHKVSPFRALSDGELLFCLLAMGQEACVRPRSAVRTSPVSRMGPASGEVGEVPVNRGCRWCR